MRYKFVLLAVLSCLFLNLFSQSKPSEKTKEFKTPKLVVGVVVDQMRIDYIYRYWNRYSNGGFKRLVSNGYFCKNTHFNYVPTYTGPGHSSIYTGTSPSVHGIIANEWYVKEKQKVVYCAEDESVKTIGSDSKSGMMSPRNQLTTTIGDELKLATNGKSKVFGIGLKDRSSILPVGHAADAAFWYDDATGNFISSSWYVNDLPQWVRQFNDKHLAKSYLEKGWNSMFPIESYTASLPDNNVYESAPNKKVPPVFPYDYKEYIEKNNWALLKATPYGNTITKDMAMACIKNEGLGKDEFPDMLCISFSSTDIIAHAYGPRAVEIEDVYLRLDKDIEELLKTLDTEVGKDNYTLFLTADHGGAEVPNYLKSLKIPAGLVKAWKVEKELKQFCTGKFGDSLINNISNQQIFLNEDKIATMKLNAGEVENALCGKLIQMEGISEAYPSSILKYEAYKTDNLKALIAAGYNHKRSGNVVFAYLPGWLDIGETGTTHGAGYAYDTHVPLIFYGSGIKKGENIKLNYITEIAPTICFLLNINLPNGCFSKPIDEVLKSEKKEKQK
jgi:predicted AlkP superfamily pyrophosphatase or phosphodiesterase